VRERAVENGHVTEDNYCTVSESTFEPEIASVAGSDGIVPVEGLEGEVENEDRLEDSIDNPFPKDASTETVVLRTLLVVPRLFHKGLLGVFLILKCKYHDR